MLHFFIGFTLALIALHEHRQALTHALVDARKLHRMALPVIGRIQCLLQLVGKERVLFKCHRLRIILHCRQQPFDLTRPLKSSIFFLLLLRFFFHDLSLFVVQLFCFARLKRFALMNTCHQLPLALFQCKRIMLSKRIAHLLLRRFFCFKRDLLTLDHRLLIFAPSAHFMQLFRFFL